MSWIDGLNKDFESRVRLGIMSALSVNERLEFNELKQMLELTDGNLSSHANTLHDRGYIHINKEFIENKPKTSYMISKKGREAFQAHLDQLAKLINR